MHVLFARQVKCYVRLPFLFTTFPPLLLTLRCITGNIWLVLGLLIIYKQNDMPVCLALSYSSLFVLRFPLYLFSYFIPFHDLVITSGCLHHDRNHLYLLRIKQTLKVRLWQMASQNCNRHGHFWFRRRCMLVGQGEYFKHLWNTDAPPLVQLFDISIALSV